MIPSSRPETRPVEIDLHRLADALARLARDWWLRQQAITPRPEEGDAADFPSAASKEDPRASAQPSRRL